MKPYEANLYSSPRTGGYRIFIARRDPGLSFEVVF
jgi:hypothetical protein